MRPAPNEVGDDRDSIRGSDRVLLVVDNDLAFAKVVMDVAHDCGFKVIVTSLGASALALAREHRPSAITLDISLPDVDGWRVLDRLKNDLTTRQIPVYVISTADDAERGWQLGAVGVLTKPIQTRDVIEQTVLAIRRFVDRKPKSLLIVTEQPEFDARLRGLITNPSIEILRTTTADEVRDVFDRQTVDSIVIDGPRPSHAMRQITEAIADDAGDHGQANRPVVIVYTDGQASVATEVNGFVAPDAVVLRQAESTERLLDLVVHALHCPQHVLPEQGRRMLGELYNSDAVLGGKKVLIVDDDIRNIFALTSVLERNNMQIVSAETGRDAIRLLQEVADVDIVLMDIMMPEMDGIATMREIRKLPRLKNLPIIAVTAKAMKGDREKCIEAGAWDYLSKPVDTEQMLSVMKAWLHR